MKRKYELLALSLMLLTAALVSLTAIFGAALNEVQSKSLYDVIKDWQTLIAGLFALVAAGIAVYPVWKQVFKMNLQSAVMSRNVLVDRVIELEKRKKATHDLIDEMVVDFLRAAYPGDPEERPDLNPEWAFNAEQRVDQIVKHLKLQQDRKRDSLRIDAFRDESIAALVTLGVCLNDVHFRHSSGLEDVEPRLSQEKIEAILERELEGEKDFDNRINSVSISASNLDETFEFEISRLRERIRDIDNLIIEDKLRA